MKVLSLPGSEERLRAIISELSLEQQEEILSVLRELGGEVRRLPYAWRMRILGESFRYPSLASFLRSE